MTLEGDIPIRLGGEEFVVFMTSKTEAQVAVLANRICRGVTALEIYADQTLLKLTISLGTAVRSQGESLTSLIERADRVLYQAKRNGRNQVIASPQH